MSNTRQMIRGFNIAFGRPVNDSWTDLTLEERILLGKLLLEETYEYVTKGLGLAVMAKEFVNWGEKHIDVVARSPDPGVNNVECVDGLADVNVVIHFNSHWHGFNLDRATEIVNESNMSKLGEDGKPIINGVTRGYRKAPFVTEVDADYKELPEGETGIECIERDDEPGFDPSKPVGKILKGPNFVEPTNQLRELIMTENNNVE